MQDMDIDTCAQTDDLGGEGGEGEGNDDTGEKM